MGSGTLSMNDETPQIRRLHDGCESHGLVDNYRILIPPSSHPLLYPYQCCAVLCCAAGRRLRASSYLLGSRHPFQLSLPPADSHVSGRCSLPQPHVTSIEIGIPPFRLRIPLHSNPQNPIQRILPALSHLATKSSATLSASGKYSSAFPNAVEVAVAANADAAALSLPSPSLLVVVSLPNTISSICPKTPEAVRLFFNNLAESWIVFSIRPTRSMNAFCCSAAIRNRGGKFSSFDLDFVVLVLLLEALACPATKRAISWMDSRVEKTVWRYCQDGAMGVELALKITLPEGRKG